MTTTRSPQIDLGQHTVGEVMRLGVVACAPDTPLSEVARLMSAHRIHCVVVGGLSFEGTRLVWGVVSDLEGHGERQPDHADLQRVAGRPERPQSCEQLEVRGEQPERARGRELVGDEIADAVLVTQLAERPVGDADQGPAEPCEEPCASC